MKKLVIILILLVGCGKLPDVKNLTIKTGNENFTQIASKPIDTDKIPDIGGKDAESIIAIYTVPASTVETKIYVYDDIKKPFRPRTKAEAKKPVSSVSTNPNVKSEYVKITPWWYWWLGYLVCSILVYFIGKKYIDLISKPLGIIRRIYEFFKK